MKFLIGSLIVFVSFFSKAQLVNDLQRNEKRAEVIKAYQNKTIVKMLDSKYAILDVNYFFIDSTKGSPDGGGLSIYRWAKDSGFLIHPDSANLSDVKVKNLKTGKIATLRYFDIYKYHDIKFTRKKHKV